MDRAREDEISYKIIGAAIEAHKCLGGPGLYESIYENCLLHELQLQGLQVETQVPVSVVYKGVSIQKPLYIDLLVEGQIIIEVKATELENPLHHTQLLTYLRLTGKRLGLVINFGQKAVKDGIERIVNGF